MGKERERRGNQRKGWKKKKEAEEFASNVNGFNFNPRNMKNHWKYLSRRNNQIWVPEF